MIQQMIKQNIDVACIQEANIPYSCLETRDSHTFVFSSNAPDKKEDWGVGLCYKINFEKYRTNYLQVSSNVAAMELSMHGNPLVIVSCYLPHDAVLQRTQPKRTAAWKELQDTINKVTEAKSLVICGDCYAAIHHRKDGEDDIIGQHVFGKGKHFLATKEERTPHDFTDNREHLVTLARTTSTAIANTFVQKNPENKISYKAMATDNGPQWTPDRYYEIDHCLVRKCWRNSVLDIATDQHTNINTDQYMTTVKVRQALKTKQNQN